MIPAPQGKRLITSDQLDVIRASGIDCLLFRFNGINWPVDLVMKTFGQYNFPMAINDQDYYHFFGYDKLLDVYFKESYNVPIRLMHSSEELFMSYCSGRHKDRWSVRRYDNTPRGYSDLTYGSETHCREFLVKRLTESLPKWYPVKVNFKFSHGLIDV